MTVIILLAFMIVSVIVQLILMIQLYRFSHIRLARYEFGESLARRMLDVNGLQDVKVAPATGLMGNYYCMKTRTIYLGDMAYGRSTLAAAAIVARECGHAMQHAAGYAPLKLRSKLLPVEFFGSNIVQWIVLGGFFLLSKTAVLFWIGIALFIFVAIVSLITLPVELDAAKRAENTLRMSGIMDITETWMAVSTLKMFCWAYVIAAIGSLATILYYAAVAFAGGKGDK